MPIEAAGLVTFRFSSGGISLLRKDDFFHSHQISELNDIRHLPVEQWTTHPENPLWHNAFDHHEIESRRTRILE